VKFSRSGPFLSDPEEGERSHEEKHLHHAEGRRCCPGARRWQRLRLAEAVDEIKATADKAVQDAAAAKAAADSAASAAASARSAADSAQSAANQALQAAQASQACCDATNEKIDRAFKKAVSK
jgi:hypothetical protein